MSATEATFRGHPAGFDVEIHAGWIPGRFAMVADVESSPVNIDVGLSEPTLASIEFFCPRMTAQCVMVFDHHGFENCPVARAAVDEHFADRPECVLHVPTGQGVANRELPG